MQDYRIMHVVEALSAGVAHSIKTIVSGYCEDIPSYIVHGNREYIPGQFDFTPEVTLVPWCAVREIAPKHDLVALLELVRIIRRVKPTLIHAHSTKAGALSRIACAITGTPCVYTPHSYAFLRQDVGNATRQAYKFIEWLLAPLATTIACGLEEYSYAVKFSKRATVVENGVDVNSFAPKMVIDKATLARPIVVAVGRITPQKNFPLFLEISQKPELVGLNFIWITGEDTIPEIPYKNVKLLGRLTPSEVAIELRAASAFINTSKWEGLSRAVLEAAATGLPLVLADAAGNRELAFRSPGVFLFDDADDAAIKLANVMDKLVASPDLGIVNRRAVAKFYDASKAQSRLRSIYDAIAYSQLSLRSMQR